MQEHKLFQYLKVFQNKEFTKFGKFLASPYFNNSDLLIALFKILKRYRPDFESKGLTKEKLFEKLFPKEPFNSKKILDLMSDMGLKIERFWVIENLQNDGIGFEKERIKVIARRNLNQSLHSKILLNHLDKLQKQPIKNADTFYQMFDIYNQLHTHPNRNHYEDVDYLQLANQSFQQYEVLTKLKLAIGILSRQSILSEKEETLDLEAILKKAANFQNESVLFDLYSQLISIQSQLAMPKEFLVLLKKLHSSQDDLPLEDFRFLALTVLNQTMKRYFAGEESFAKVQFKIYKLVNERDLMFNNQTLNESFFLNAVITASVVKEFDWGENFIKEKSPFLPLKIRELATNLAWAYFHFHQTEYATALSFLPNTNFENIGYNLRCRYLSIRCWYSLFLEDDTQQKFLEDAIFAFEQFLRRNQKFHPKKNLGYLNSIKMIQKLIPFKLKRITKKQKIALLEMLENYEQVIGKNWLKEQINALRATK